MHSAIEVVNTYFEAMRAGPDGAKRLFPLFAKDAIYVEPFAGETRTHRGRPAIEACFNISWKSAPPEMKIKINRIDVDGETVRSDWTCSSPAFPAPVKGTDICVVRGGLIHQLTVEIHA